MYLLLYIIMTYGILKYKFIFFTSAEINGSVDCEHGKEQPTNKRFVHIHYLIYISCFLLIISNLSPQNISPRSESGTRPSSKACREKVRRDKLNER